MVLRSLAFTLLLAGCTAPPASIPRNTASAGREVELFDTDRQRPIPVVLYQPSLQGSARPLAIISHGYGGRNTDYGFIARDLVRRGYLVASIEHLDRQGDPPMVNSGDLAKLRRPVWQVGADSIGFVVRELRRRGLADETKVVLIGHSNGGDMTMLFSSEHPEDVRFASSLDNRRMPLPRTAHPRICSARSANLADDPGVLPTVSEREAFAMVIMDVAVNHDDMWDGASAEQQQMMLDVLSTCLTANRKT